jgi:hypothetical protein
MGCDNLLESVVINSHITGVVTDKETDLPIDSAVVYLYSTSVTTSDGHNFNFKRTILKETYTDSFGRYKIFMTLAKGDLYFLGAKKDGYISSPPPYSILNENRIGFPDHHHIKCIQLTKSP